MSKLLLGGRHIPLVIAGDFNVCSRGSKDDGSGYEALKSGLLPLLDLYDGPEISPTRRPNTKPWARGESAKHSLMRSRIWKFSRCARVHPQRVVLEEGLSPDGVLLHESPYKDSALLHESPCKDNTLLQKRQYTDYVMLHENTYMHKDCTAPRRMYI